MSTRDPVRMLSVKEAARRLGRDEGTLRKELRSDNPPFVYAHSGTFMKISELVLEDYIARTRLPRQPEKPKGPGEPIELATSGSQERPCPHCGGPLPVSLKAQVVIAPQ